MDLEAAQPSHDAPPASPDSEKSDTEHTLAKDRARRPNAGNRMQNLIALQSAEPEQWGEEWDEAPDEEEFVGQDVNDLQDFNLDSSSSEDDEENDVDDAGEKELQRAERQDRIKKRKPATNPFAARIAATRKKVKLDLPPSDAPAAPSRPKKKSERASWIPTPEDGPIRTSSRKQTVANKEHTLAKLKEKDRRRDDTLAMMKAAEARKAKDEPMVMTQAERLAEAARVERVNSKSLHRWEEAEEQRAAERQAKLDALKNRQIEGPFIRYWSGPAIFVDDKVKYMGKDIPKIEDLEEKLNKEVTQGLESQASQPGTEKRLSISGPDSHNLVPGPMVQGQTMQALLPHATPSQPNTSQGQMGPQEPTSQTVNTPQMQTPNQIHDRPIVPNSMSYPSTAMLSPQDVGGFLSGIEQYATPQHGTPHQVPPQQPPPQFSTPQNHPPFQPSPQGYHDGFMGPPTTQPDQPQSHFPSNPFSHPSTCSQHNGHNGHSPIPHPSLSDPALAHNTMNPQSFLQQFQRPPPPPAPPRKRVIRKALRNLLILSSFPNLSENLPLVRTSRTTSSMIKEKDRSALIQLSSSLFGWTIAEATAYVTSMLTAPKTKKEREGASKVKKELCAVTNKVARYRDPGTGIAYHDQKAFAVLRGVVGGAFVWSGALGCYVGGRPGTGTGVQASPGTKPALGVPRRFVEMGAVVPPVVFNGPGPGNGNGNGNGNGGNGAVAAVPEGGQSFEQGGAQIVKVEESATTTK